MDLKEIGKRLRIARITKGLTQAEVQKLRGINDARLSRYELGKNLPYTGDLIKLCELYGVSADHILCLDRAVKKI